MSMWFIETSSLYDTLGLIPVSLAVLLSTVLTFLPFPQT